MSGVGGVGGADWDAWGKQNVQSEQARGEQTIYKGASLTWNNLQDPNYILNDNEKKQAKKLYDYFASRGEKMSPAQAESFANVGTALVRSGYIPEQFGENIYEGASVTWEDINDPSHELTAYEVRDILKLLKSLSEKTDLTEEEKLKLVNLKTALCRLPEFKDLIGDPKSTDISSDMMKSLNETFQQYGFISDLSSLTWDDIRNKSSDDFTADEIAQMLAVLLDLAKKSERGTLTKLDQQHIEDIQTKLKGIPYFEIAISDTSTISTDKVQELRGIFDDKHGNLMDLVVDLYVYGIDVDVGGELAPLTQALEFSNNTSEEFGEILEYLDFPDDIEDMDLDKATIASLELNNFIYEFFKGDPPKIDELNKQIKFLRAHGGEKLADEMQNAIDQMQKLYNVGIGKEHINLSNATKVIGDGSTVHRTDILMLISENKELISDFKKDIDSVIERAKAFSETKQQKMDQLNTKMNQAIQILTAIMEILQRILLRIARGAASS